MREQRPDNRGAAVCVDCESNKEKVSEHLPRAGSRYAWPSTHVGHELIGAGMLILAGNGRGLPFDYDELERWTRVGYKRGCGHARANGNEGAAMRLLKGNKESPEDPSGLSHFARLSSCTGVVSLLQG
jgi:hypothetical protein